MELLIVSFISLLINLPFGYWRSNVPKFSLQWIIAIHLPVIFIIAFRILSGLGFAIITYPVLIAAFILGQLLGGRIYHHCKRVANNTLTSCMVVDMYKYCLQNK